MAGKRSVREPSTAEERILTSDGSAGEVCHLDALAISRHEGVQYAGEIPFGIHESSRQLSSRPAQNDEPPFPDIT